MSLIVLLLGILAAAAGLASIGYAVPISGTDLGRTLIIAGATALTGGLVLLGLAAVVRQLTRVAEDLRFRPHPAPVEMPLSSSDSIPARPEPLMPRVEPVAPAPDIAPYVPRAAAEPQLASPSSEVSSSAIERLRSTLPRPDRMVPEAEEVPLSPGGNAIHPTPEPPPLEPAAPTMRPGLGEDAPTRPQRLDFLFRSRPPSTPVAPPSSPSTTPPGQRDPLESMWPKRPTRPRDPQPPASEAETRPPPPPTTTESRPREQRPAPEPMTPPTVEEAPSVAILKSGVVDGMAYTLYADGSIEAQLPQGTVRFASITELRAHIETNS
jgi:hypothetical protein